jgi:hypothetical protein
MQMLLLTVLSLLVPRATFDDDIDALQERDVAQDVTTDGQ